MEASHWTSRSTDTCADGYFIDAPFHSRALGFTPLAHDLGYLIDRDGDGAVLAETRLGPCADTRPIDKGSLVARLETRDVKARS